MISHLIHGGFDPALVENSLDLLAVEVGEADCFDQTFVDELLEGFPSLQVVDVRGKQFVVRVLREQIVAFLMSINDNTNICK